MDVSRWAKCNKSCLLMKRFQANDRLFFGKKWTCRNRTTITTQNSQFWVVHNHFFSSCPPRNQENQPLRTDHLSPRQCESSHVCSNNYIFEHRFDESFAVSKNWNERSRFFDNWRSGWCFQNGCFEDTSIRVAKVLRQLVQTHAKVYTRRSSWRIF